MQFTPVQQGTALTVGQYVPEGAAEEHSGGSDRRLEKITLS